MNTNRGTLCMMYVMCIGILSRYVMLVWMHTIDIYVRHDIMQVFPFLRRMVTCNVLCPTKSSPGGMFMSPPSGSMCAYEGRVRSTMYPTLSRT